MTTPETLYERIHYYHKQQIQIERRNTIAFNHAVANGDYPEKCLECYKVLNYCRFWQTSFNCEPFDVQQEIEKLEGLGV
jgi:hypothetical protein